MNKYLHLARLNGSTLANLTDELVSAARQPTLSNERIDYFIHDFFSLLNSSDEMQLGRQTILQPSSKWWLGAWFIASMSGASPDQTLSLTVSRDEYSVNVRVWA